MPVQTAGRWLGQPRIVDVHLARNFLPAALFNLLWPESRVNRDMRWRLIALVSLGVNIVLAAAWLLSTRALSAQVCRHARPSLSHPPATQTKTNFITRRQLFSWRDVESADYADLRRQPARHWLPGADHPRHHHRRVNAALRAQARDRTGDRGPAMVAQRAGPGGGPSRGGEGPRAGR